MAAAVLGDFQGRLEESICCTEAALSSKLQSDLRRRLQEGQKEAAQAAPSSVQPWCRPMGQGGLHWATFRATVTRHGKFREDWNEVLATPMLRRLSASWEQFFSEDAGSQLEKLRLGMTDAVEHGLEELGA